MTRKLSFESYQQWAEQVIPVLRSALGDKYQVPQQRPFVEAWIGYALYSLDRHLSVEEIIESADSINHGIPSPDEVAWAFLSLRKRGWLSAQGDKYGLTVEGRRAISAIIAQGSVERLEGWISTHSASTPVSSREVFLTLGKNKAR